MELAVSIFAVCVHLASNAPGESLEFIYLCAISHQQISLQKCLIAVISLLSTENSVFQEIWKKNALLHFICFLQPEWTAACRVSFTSISLQHTKLSLEESRFPDSLFWTSWDLAKNGSRTHLTISFNIGGHPDPSALYRQLSSLKFWCHVQICIAIGSFLANFLSNACCTLWFNYVQPYSNVQNAFSLPVNRIYIPEKNINHRILSCFLIFWDQLDKNLSVIWLRYYDINFSETPCSMGERTFGQITLLSVQLQPKSFSFSFIYYI